MSAEADEVLGQIAKGGFYKELYEAQFAGASI